MSSSSADDYYIHDLPGLIEQNDIRQYAGHIQLKDKHESRIFFWLLKRRYAQPQDRLIIWFNGGPGCSSMDGLFMEIGPYRPTSNGTLEINPFSWHDYAHVLFVDQPVGTGFSHTKDRYFHNNIYDVARDMRVFLREFFKIFPEHTNNEVYLAGESYAGVYIPYIAKEILDGNKQQDTDLVVNLSGLAMGNAWIDPYAYYSTYLEFAQTYHLLNASQVERIKYAVDLCMEDIKEGVIHIKTESCEGIFDGILEASYRTEANGTMTCLNVYDFRLRDPYPECGMAWPPILPNVYSYLAREDVVTAIHAQTKTTKWVECDDDVYNALTGDKSAPSYLLLPHLLEELRILIFNGDQDALCNHIGAERTIERLTWDGATGFQAVEPQYWQLENRLVGLWQTRGNLHYARIFNGSHMVSVDKTYETYDMINRFMNVTPYLSEQAPKLGILTAQNTVNISNSETNHSLAPTLAAVSGIGLLILGILLVLWRSRRSRVFVQKGGLEAQALIFDAEESVTYPDNTISNSRNSYAHEVNIALDTIDHAK